MWLLQFFSTFEPVSVFVFPEFLFFKAEASFVSPSARNPSGIITKFLGPHIFTRGIRCCYDADAPQMRKGSGLCPDFLFGILCYLRISLLLCFFHFLPVIRNWMCHQDRFLRSWPSRILQGEPCGRAVSDAMHRSTFFSTFFRHFDTNLICSCNNF